MRVRRRDSEAGFTMIPVVLGMTLVVALSVVAVAAVSGDVHMNRYDLDRKRAYEAAKAGVNDYLFQLREETDYWTQCDEVDRPEDHAINLNGASPLDDRPVPGNTGARYAIELLPAEDQDDYTQCDREDPAGSMLESSGLMRGTFRIRSTGFAGDAEVPVIATFKPATFLDYVYFTQLETSDPVTYGFEEGSSALNGAYSQCGKTMAEGRYLARIPGTYDYCDVISFVSGDVINGPMHTNDAFAICGTPTLGRNSSDPIEMSGPYPGWYPTEDIPTGSNCDGNDSNFKGTKYPGAPSILPPATNSELKSIAGLKFSGQVRICLNGSNIAVGAGKTCTDSPLYSGEIPQNGVVYVEDATCLGGEYSPFTAIYLETSGCGNAYVRGSYTGQLTIAAEKDIIINGSLIHSEEGVLGLVANNFVRIYHPFSSDSKSTQTRRGRCEGGQNGTGSVKNLRIDAAILAISHSFIVDHYDCGGSLGKLTVNGALAQKYRGAVGTTGNTGYIKDYNYDDRLRFMQPPHFTEPQESDWVIGRLTLE